MATTYDTLTLSGVEEAPKKRPIAKYVAAAFLVVALAGVAGFAVSGAANPDSAEDWTWNLTFKSNLAQTPYCAANANTRRRYRAFVARLPKYDTKWSEIAARKRNNGNPAFYNACYYAYRCCTTVQKDCLVSSKYGAKCRSCLKNNGPKMIIPTCTDYMKLPSKYRRGYGLRQIIAGVLPRGNYRKRKTEPYKTWFGKLALLRKRRRSCWRRATGKDPRMAVFTKKCFEVVSWCNLLCPRDDATTTDHKMCKECINIGFAAKTKFVNGKQVKA